MLSPCKRLVAAATAAFALLATPAQAALRVLACEPEWAALAQELGGPLVHVASATTAQQDPHQVQARPSLIARVRNADLVVCTGADLEAGWLADLAGSGVPDRRPRWLRHLWVGLDEVAGLPSAEPVRRAS